MSRAFPRAQQQATRAAIVITTALACAVLAAGPAAAKAAPTAKDADATGRVLVTKFMTILQSGDRAALAKFLDPAFQLQRADGTGANRAQYLANPAKVGQFVLGDTVTGVQHGDVLTVRWTLRADVNVSGTQYSANEAPRLSVFRWTGNAWRMISHANFNVPAPT